MIGSRRVATAVIGVGLVRLGAGIALVVRRERFSVGSAAFPTGRRWIC